MEQMKRQRDHKAEYNRRKAKGQAEGLPLSVIRGHARSGEAPIRAPPRRVHDDRLEQALKELRRSRNQKQAAKSVGVSVERFRRFLRENVVIEGRGRSLEIKDDRLRSDSVITTKGVKDISFPGFEQASLIRRHKLASLSATETNNPELMDEFRKVKIVDHRNRMFSLETDLNALHRIRSADEGVFHELYRHT